MKVAIYGGTFNPIHKGHTGLAQAVCKTGLVDEVWLMVSPLNPLKRNQQTDLQPTDVRLHMARLATQGIACLRVSDFETHLPVPSYTYNTLQELRRAYPEHTFSLLVGEDNWERFPQWYRGDEIRAQHDIVVYGRNRPLPSPPQGEGVISVFSKGSNHSLPLGRVGKGSVLYEVSSTQIRESLRSGPLAFARRWLHPAVYRYVRQQRLYQF